VDKCTNKVAGAKAQSTWDKVSFHAGEWTAIFASSFMHKPQATQTKKV